MRTPATSAIDFMAAISMRMDSSNEMLGTRLICGVRAPSFIVGMNDLPSSGNSAKEPNNSATDTPNVSLL